MSGARPQKKWDVCGWFCDVVQTRSDLQKTARCRAALHAAQRKNSAPSSGRARNSWDTVFPGRLDVGFRMFIYVCIASILDLLMSAIYIHVYKGPGERLEMHHVKARDPGFHTPRSDKFLAHALRDCSR